MKLEDGVMLDGLESEVLDLLILVTVVRGKSLKFPKFYRLYSAPTIEYNELTHVKRSGCIL